MSEETWFPFETLNVWNEAVEYGLVLYEITRTFPDSERFGLTSQMQRAGTSISFNLSEGAGRSTPKNRLQFLDIARGSLFETVTQLHFAFRLGYTDEATHRQMRSHAASIAKQMEGYRRYLKSL